jgi:hypothetical protein
MLSNIYPEYTFDKAKFSAVPRHYWNEKENVAQFLQQVKDRLGISQVSDWHLASNRYVIFWQLRFYTRKL